MDQMQETKARSQEASDRKPEQEQQQVFGECVSKLQHGIPPDGLGDGMDSTDLDQARMVIKVIE